MSPNEIANLILQGLPDAQVEVRSDDNTHFEARVVSPAFAGKRPLQRHQMVYKTLGALMGNEIHAMSIQALAPDEAPAN
ncbi:MAG: BolA/IbaG family iron-sulfur metabolism protein [Gammaproteobacteria bacterium]|jgi:acid stress-induced BolA-like protein IbaG/YrbA|nr:BolA/IbaG family iron-sulfur metabolism protein [Gammaproteobacteria bacterium]